MSDRANQSEQLERREHAPEVDLSESLEDYLLAIADLAELTGGQSAPRVHSGDVAVRAGVSNASVTHAFRSLRERGLIEYERYHAVRLTEEGRRVARQVMARKQALIRFFSDVLKLEREEAEQNAHRMEHVITPRAVERLEELVERLDGIIPGRPDLTDQ